MEQKIETTEKGKVRTTSLKSTQSARKVRHMVAGMYSRAREAKDRGQKVAYVMVGCESEEILAAMDIVPMYTENYAGLCSASRKANRYIEKAHAEGYSDLICSYARTVLGHDALRKETGMIPSDAPDGGLVKPDMLLGSSNSCDIRYKWYQAEGRYLDAPAFPVDVPPPPSDRDSDQVRDQYVKYLTAELRSLITFLENQTGKKMDYDRLWEIINRVQEMNQWARKANELRKTVPCPMGAQDGFSTFVPARMMPTSLETLDFYKGLYYELKEKVDNGIGIAEQENYRLLWGGGVPPWHSMYILDYFLSYGAVFVFETTYSRNLIPFEIPTNITDPVEAISLRNFEQRTMFNGRPIKGSDTPAPILPYLDWIKDFAADGMVTHASRSCRASTVGKRFLSQLLQERLPLPFLAIEGDLADLSAFSEDETKNRIDIFMELMADKKAVNP